MYVLIFWTAKYERKSCLDWMVSLQVLSHSKLIFLSKNCFSGIYLNFKRQKSLKNQYLPHFESKSYQVNSIKSGYQDLSNNTKGMFQLLQNFQLWFNFIFSEEIIQYSRCPGTNPMHHSSSRAFQTHQEHDLKHPGLVDLITTEQNKTNYLPS